MGKGKLWPSAKQKPLNRSSPYLNGVITSWIPTIKKFGLNSPRGFCYPHKWNIHPSCSTFTTLFWFFNSPTGKCVTPIFTLNSLRQMTRFCARSCLFIVIKKFVFHLFISKIRKKITMPPRGKFTNFLNCHNFGCVQDKVVIFDSRIWF